MRLPRAALLVAAVAAGIPPTASATDRCAALLAHFGGRLADVTCFESTDLTTNNPNTTPADNSLAGLPAFAFTPQTDRKVLVDLAKHPAPSKAVPGVQLDGRIADDPLGQARFLLRLPNDWNGRLVVAGAPSQRSEFASDLAWSDFVVAQGYAYASQNKGTLAFTLSTATDPLACRLNPASQTYVRFYDDDPAMRWTRWAFYMADAAFLARDGVRSFYGQGPRFTYAVGTSNGGYQVRRALESYWWLFDGGVDWEGTYVSPEAPNLLTDLPPAVLNFPDYLASGFDQAGTAARNLRLAGYPPDVVAPDHKSSLWSTYSNAYWELTLCNWQKRFDPTYDTYGPDGLGPTRYNYTARRSVSDVASQLAAVATTGDIHRPLVTVAGTLDALLPIDHHARAYARKVAEHAAGDGPWLERGDARRRGPQYRLYEVQNGNHIEGYKELFPQLELLEPHVQKAFALLVAHVEQGADLPPSQCIPTGGGAISATPAQPGHCANLLE